MLVEWVLSSRTKTGWFGRWGLASPALCLHRPPAPSMQLPPHRACALTRTHRAPLQRHMGSTAAWARPPTSTTEVEEVTETPKLLSYSSFKDRLSIDIQPVRPLRTEALAADCHACHMFRSCRFARLQRFAPHRPVWACCIPLPTMRFTWFRAGQRLLQAENTTLLAGAPPFGVFPSWQRGTPSPGIAASSRYALPLATLAA